MKISVHFFSKKIWRSEGKTKKRKLKVQQMSAWLNGLSQLGLQVNRAFFRVESDGRNG